MPMLVLSWSTHNPEVASLFTAHTTSVIHIHTKHRLHMYQEPLLCHLFFDTSLENLWHRSVCAGRVSATAVLLPQSPWRPESPPGFSGAPSGCVMQRGPRLTVTKHCLCQARDLLGDTPFQKQIKQNNICCFIILKVWGTMFSLALHSCILSFNQSMSLSTYCGLSQCVRQNKGEAAIAKK